MKGTAVGAEAVQAPVKTAAIKPPNGTCACALKTGKRNNAVTTNTTERTDTLLLPKSNTIRKLYHNQFADILKNRVSLEELVKECSGFAEKEVSLPHVRIA